MSSELSVPSSEREYFFGPFRFIPAQQLLLHGDTPLRLGGRALEILAVLLERPGELLTKQELIARVWPNHVVDGSNLKVHVAGLRRALGEVGWETRYVATLSGRGYRFVAPVTYRSTVSAPPASRTLLQKMSTLPAPTARTIGRTETIAALLGAMEQHRVVSIVGAGGIGKSTVMLAVSEAFVTGHGVDLCFVDLSPLSDAQFVLGSVASALGLEMNSRDGLPSLMANLRERRLLLVLDSCEHVIDEVAVLVGNIVAGAPGIQVLATSRERLRSAGEYVHRLVPLAFPQAADISAGDALAYPAVQLFVQRAAESLEGYQLSDDDAPAVAEICLRLEGIPLAIELAATRMDAFGARELAAQLDQRFRILKRGRRSANARHRTLEEALDWSYDYLPLDEGRLLCTCAVFARGFSLEAAVGVCADDMTDAATVVEGIASLADKSLLSADVSGPRVYYRLLDTTKAYALEKLELRGELDVMRRRHLAYYRSMFERASAEWEARSGVDWLASYGRNLDDVRSALAWAFSPNGDTASGIALTVAAIPLWMELSLLEEGRNCIERALSCLEPGEGVAVRDEMRLHAALGAATLYASGPLPATNAAWTRLLDLADEQRDSAYQLMAMWGMATYRSYRGEFQSVQELSARFGALAASIDDQAAMVGMERLIGTAFHFSGQQDAARRHLEAMLNHYVSGSRRSSMARFQLDQRSAALGTLANALWLQGYADQAIQTVRAALQEARDVKHATSLMNAIATAGFPIMVFVGDDDAADSLSGELAKLLTKHALPLWETLSRCMQATLQVRRGDAAALPLLHEAVDKLKAGGFRLRLTCHLGTLAAALGAQGRRGEGLLLACETLSFCESGEERWCHAELLRIKGELIEADDAGAAEEAYHQALQVARQQGALAWELRAAINLAQLKARQGAAEEGRQALSAVYAKFSEGFGTADLRRAEALLNPAR